MTETPDEPTTFDALVDRLLRGHFVDPQSAGSELSETERRSLRGIAEALGGHLTGPQTPSLPPGCPDHLGSYRVLSELGRGGMGVVYLAEDPDLGRRVALKALRTELSSSPEAIERFRREAQSVARLDHRNIVTVHEVGEDAGIHFLAMEHIPGPGLDDRIRKAKELDRKLEIRQVVRWARDVARALAAAHAAGIIHRDVKPSNIRIADDDRAVLLDFGLAQDEARSSLTATGAFRGSPHYASPEQVAAKRILIDHRTDVYSLGVTLYEALTLTVPFEGETKEQVFQQILLVDAPSARERNPRLPRDLEIVIAKAMEKNPERRYASAVEFGDDLDALLAVRPISARPPGGLRRALRWMRRHRRTTVAAAILFLIGFSALVTFAGQRLADEFEHRERVSVAERELASGRAGPALRALELALSARPNDQRVRTLRDAAALTVAEDEAGHHLAKAQHALEEFRQARQRFAPAFAAAPGLRDARFERRFTDELEGELLRVERTLSLAGLHAEDAFFRALESVNSAERAVGPTAASRELRAAVLYERWLEAGDRGESSRRRALEDRIRESDDRGLYVQLLQIPATLRVEAPPDAETFLFRFQDSRDLQDSEDVRIVPVPAILDRHHIRPGSHALRVKRTRSDLREGDLILAVEGFPVFGTVIVRYDDRYWQLTSMGSVEVRSLADALLARHGAVGKPTQHTPAMELRDRSGATITVTNGDAAKIELVPWVDLLKEMTGSVTILRDGEEFAQHLREGADVVPTAIPLEIGPASRLGRGSVERSLAPGSYLLVVRSTAQPLARIPFRLASGTSTVIPVDLPRGAAIPRDFAWITGRGGIGVGPTPSVWMLDREVLGREYQEFLDAPETRGEMRAARPGLIRAPRSTLRGDTRFIWGDQVGERFVIDAEALSRPVTGISAEDADSYAKWFARRNGFPESRVRLPTSDELEWAGLSADERPHPFGVLMFPRWIKCYWAHAIDRPEAPYSYPIDESPFGIYDLVGSMLEWTSTAEEGLRFLRGCSWTTRTSALDLGLRNRMAFPPAQTSNQFGFRLVITE